jgi:toxin ParE1/3/4
VSVEWSGQASNDLLAIFDYILQDDPAAAIRMEERIRLAAGRLADHPRMGRPGRAPRTRELPIPGSPYLLVYRTDRERVQILRVFHGTQDWQPKI